MNGEVKEQAKVLPEVAKEQASLAMSSASKAVANGTEVVKETLATVKVPETVEASATAAKETVQKTINQVSEAAKSATAVTQSTQPISRSPPQSSFKPQLPSDLPEPSSTALSANRKRKTPQDFTPAGPRDAPTPSSPSKISVKFEDGVGPGEGAEGEKTIPVKAPVKAVKKNQNMVERTLWTFIMIGGFIGELPVLRASKGPS